AAIEACIGGEREVVGAGIDEALGGANHIEGIERIRFQLGFAAGIVRARAVRDLGVAPHWSSPLNPAHYSSAPPAYKKLQPVTTILRPARQLFVRLARR